MEIGKNECFSIPEDVLIQDVNDEVVLLDLASEHYFGMDEEGARIWMLLKEQKAAGEIVEELLQEYEVDRADLETDVHELLAQLLEAGLIRRVNPERRVGAGTKIYCPGWATSKAVRRGLFSAGPMPLCASSQALR